MEQEAHAAAVPPPPRLSRPPPPRKRSSDALRLSNPPPPRQRQSGERALKRSSKNEERVRQSFLMGEEEQDLSEEEPEATKEEMQRRIEMLTSNVVSLENQVGTLARQLAEPPPMTAHSTFTARWPSVKRSRGPRSIREKPPQNTFLNPLDSESNLNPMGSNFDYTAWIKNLMAIGSDGKGKPKQRSISLVFRNLGVYGVGSPTSYQMDVYTVLLSLGNFARRMVGSGTTRTQILTGFDGMLRRGEMLLVLGRPGSGCSTLLKTITGEMNGIFTDGGSHLNYQGISAEQIRTQFRGEAIYTAEEDVHFPQLTVAQTLSFAAHARVPENRINGVSRSQYAEHMKDVVMAIFGLTHVANTQVGNDYIRGVSGGERKRVSIAEATLNGSPLQAWDNSTRGLDAANAVEFCKKLRIQSDLFLRTACVAIYQTPEAAYNLFHKVTLLYEGRQIYYGKAQDAKKFFTDMGFVCPDRQTTADFLTSLTQPEERIVRKGFEYRVPRTPDEFVKAWKSSSTYRRLVRNMDAFDKRYTVGGKSGEKFIEMRKAEQAKTQRADSPFTISIPMQIRLCMSRGFARLRADAGFLITSVICQVMLSVVVGSGFYNLGVTSDSAFSRSGLLFFAALLNAFSTALEVPTLFAQRPVVEKHARYALYHPFTEALSSIFCDLPTKMLSVLLFNIPLYFITNLRREAGAFFLFYLFTFGASLMMSFCFRAIAALSRTIAQALAPTAIMSLGMCVYTGFPIPVTSMLAWSRWMNYIDPVAYVFESLMINEFAARNYTCSQFIPEGPGFQAPGPNSICSTVGALPGQAVLIGDDYLSANYQYFPSHLWRNYGIMWLFTAFFLALYLIAIEFITEERSKGEVLLFRRKHKPEGSSGKSSSMGPASPSLPSPLARRAPMTHGRTASNIQKHKSTIHWRDVCYDVTVGKEQKRILDHVDGWVKPGTCTALMGASGAGKTTLLDVLASRVRTGVVTGDILVDGVPRDLSFQRKTGYVQQSDLHLSTSTVREALRFSAVLRQPAHIPVSERVAYVEEVIKLLDMGLYADAVVGVPGEGLNVEQRKRLTIAIELVARPQLLVLLDEPTSGLDSQTAWSIMNLLETLKGHGQAVLCTIHQPSATIFQRFDRLLFLAKGRTVYFGEIGTNASKLIQYFEANGSHPCPPDANPAEWMLEVIGAAPGSKATQEWTEVWRRSSQYQQTQMHLGALAQHTPPKALDQDKTSGAEYDEIAAPFWLQVRECSYRLFSHVWRTPSYLYSKFALTLVVAIYIGFTFFRSSSSQQGVQNQILAIFMLMTIFGNYIGQIIPLFVQQRNLFEARERPAKIYSWQAFLLVTIGVELFWTTIVAAGMYFSWYYPIGMYQSGIATGTVLERGGLMFLFILAFMLFAATFAFFIVAGMEGGDEAAAIGNLLWSISLTFCGVLITPQALPGFWTFMYRVSPGTYFVGGMVSTAVGNTELVCSDTELLQVPPPQGVSCQQYLGQFLEASGGYLQNSTTNSNCLVCPASSTDALLANFSIYYSDRWRNLGIASAFILFNILFALGLYWLARMPHQTNKKPAKASAAASELKSPKPKTADVSYKMYDGSPAPGQQTPFSPSSSFTSVTYTEFTRCNSMSSLVSSLPPSTAFASVAPTPSILTPAVRRVDRSLPMTPVSESSPTRSHMEKEPVREIPPMPARAALKTETAKSRPPPARGPGAPSTRYSTLMKNQRKPSGSGRVQLKVEQPSPLPVSSTISGPLETNPHEAPLPPPPAVPEVQQNHWPARSPHKQRKLSEGGAPSFFSEQPPSTGMAPSSITTTPTSVQPKHFSSSSQEPPHELPTSRNSLAPPTPARRRSRRDSSSSMGSEVEYNANRVSWGGRSDKRSSWNRALLPIMDFGEDFEFSTSAKQSGDGRVAESHSRKARPAVPRFGL